MQLKQTIIGRVEEARDQRSARVRHFRKEEKDRFDLCWLMTFLLERNVILLWNGDKRSQVEFIGAESFVLSMSYLTDDTRTFKYWLVTTLCVSTRFGFALLNHFFAAE